MSHTALKAFILWSLAAYAVGGLATEILLPGREKGAIPFYSWFLFNLVPNHMQVYAVEISEQNGRVFDPPLPFRAAVGIVANPASPKARELIQRIGDRLNANDERTADALRRSFERTFLPTKTSYRIVRLEYDPLERWRNGVLTTVPLQTFTTGELQ